MEYKVDTSYNMECIILCPGIMKEVIKHVRPIMSLDAAHLKSQWRGTLYVASVKTACDNIYPVAMAITRENWNKDGWTWFLELLHDALEILVMKHPKARVHYKYFLFISDGQKGLIKDCRKYFQTTIHRFALSTLPVIHNTWLEKSFEICPPIGNNIFHPSGR